MLITEFLRKLASYPDEKALTVEWNSGLRVKGIMKAFGETVNDEDQDYYAAFVQVSSVEGTPYDPYIQVGNIMEIEVFHPPTKIYDSENNLIWSE